MKYSEYSEFKTKARKLKNFIKSMLHHLVNNKLNCGPRSTIVSENCVCCTKCGWMIGEEIKCFAIIDTYKPDYLLTINWNLKDEPGFESAIGILNNQSEAQKTISEWKEAGRRYVYIPIIITRYGVFHLEDEKNESK